MEGSGAENIAIDSELNEIDPYIKHLHDVLVNASFRYNVRKIRPKVRINPHVSVNNIPPRGYDENR